MERNELYYVQMIDNIKYYHGIVEYVVQNGLMSKDGLMDKYQEMEGMLDP